MGGLDSNGQYRGSVLSVSNRNLPPRSPVPVTPHQRTSGAFANTVHRHTLNSRPGSENRNTEFHAMQSRNTAGHPNLRQSSHVQNLSNGFKSGVFDEQQDFCVSDSPNPQLRGTQGSATARHPLGCSINISKIDGHLNEATRDLVDADQSLYKMFTQTP